MDLTRLLREKKFYFSVLAAWTGIVLGAEYPQAADQAYPAGTFLGLTAGALRSGIVRFMLPLTAVWPMGEEYLREKRWNFLRFLLIRRGRREYCRDRVLTTLLSGALVWAAAAFLGTLFFFLLFFAREEVSEDLAGPCAECLLTAGRVCLIAGALSSFSAVCALLWRSVYLTFGLPFLLFYFGMILRERYLEKFFCIDPAQWIQAKDETGAVWIFLILSAGAAALTHYLLLMRRLEEV